MGEFAALGAALCWSIAPIFFTLSGRKASSGTINRIRLLFSCIFLFCAHLILVGLPSPQTMGYADLGWLALSGIIGLAIGDTFLLKAFLIIGPRLVTLIMTLVPLISALLAYLIFNEAFSPKEGLGAVLCLGGIIFVVVSHRKLMPPETTQHFGKGVIYAILAALGQALGLICAKQGLSGDIPVVSAVLVRMVAAMAIMWLIQGVGKQLSALKGMDATTWLYILVGTAIGPFLGVWLSILAIELTRVGLAATLMALTPILILPFSYIFLKESITKKAIAGSLVALLGVILIVAV